jgi:hypothetical protein
VYSYLCSGITIKLKDFNVLRVTLLLLRSLRCHYARNISYIAMSKRWAQGICPCRPAPRTALVVTMSHLTWNWPRQHAATAAGNELVTTRNSRRVPLRGLRVTWDTRYYEEICTSKHHIEEFVFSDNFPWQNKIRLHLSCDIIWSGHGNLNPQIIRF